MTSTDLATVNESSIELLPPKRPPAQAAIAMLEAHANMMQTAHHLASAMVNTQMVPVRFRGKADDGAAAILYGAELGLNPLQALQRVVPIHGMPSLEAQTMVGLLKARGYRVKTTAQSDDSVTVEGWDLDGDHYESTWTIERALRAEYVPTQDAQGKWRLNANGKVLGNMKYITDPQAMLKAKARAEVCRDMAPDVLLGIAYSSEELESERWDSEPQPRQQRAAEPVTVEEIFGDPAPAPAPQPKPKPEKVEKVAERAEAIQQATEQLAEPVVVDEPAEAASESRPEPDTAQASDPEPVEEIDENAPVKVRQLFALLAEGGIPGGAQHREDRLTLFRAIAERAEINSTNDLQPRELNRVIAKLKGWKEAGTLEADVAEVLWKAAEAEAIAKETAATTGDL